MKSEYHSESRATKQFAEWANLFSGEIFVKIAAYIDDSGTHDRTGKEPGSEQVVVCGWVDWRDNWVKFCGEWQSILNKYDATYFHFVDWAYASRIIRNGGVPSSSFAKNPYRGWSLGKLDDFLYELAEMAGGGQKIYVGGFISTRDFVEAKKHPYYSRFAPANDPYQACLNQFFEAFPDGIQQQWTYWKEPVSFFFDHNDDRSWSHAVHDAFAASKERDSRIAELSFVDGKIAPHLPIQAADMICGRMRQIVANFTDLNILPNPKKLDDLLIKPMMSRASPEYMRAVFKDFSSVLSLRYGNFPWRKKT